MGLIYFVMVVLIPCWWFIPIILFGKSHKEVLDNFFNYIYCYWEV